MRKFIVVGIVGLTLAGCNSEINQPKYLAGERLVTGDSNFNSAEGRALVAIFNEQNGKVYCVPNLDERQLVEFKSSLPALLVQNTFKYMNDEIVIHKLTDKPLEYGLELALKDKYPCATPLA